MTIKAPDGYLAGTYQPNFCVVGLFYPIHRRQPDSDPQLPYISVLKGDRLGRPHYIGQYLCPRLGVCGRLGNQIQT